MKKHIGEDEGKGWDAWPSELPKISHIVFLRCLEPANFVAPTVTEIHHFAVASQIAYGTVSYLRFVTIAEVIHCSFLATKSRLAHVKPMTVPRLE